MKLNGRDIQIENLKNELNKHLRLPYQISKISFSLSRPNVSFSGEFSKCKYTPSGWKFDRDGYRLVVPLAAVVEGIKVEAKKIFLGSGFTVRKSTGHLPKIEPGESVQRVTESELATVPIGELAWIFDRVGHYTENGVKERFVADDKARDLFLRTTGIHTYGCNCSCVDSILLYGLGENNVYRNLPNLKVSPRTLLDKGISLSSGSKEFSLAVFGSKSFVPYLKQICSPEDLEAARGLRNFFTDEGRLNFSDLKRFLDARRQFGEHLGDIGQQSFVAPECRLLVKFFGFDAVAKIPQLADTLIMTRYMLVNVDSQRLERNFRRHFSKGKHSANDVHDYLTRVLGNSKGHNLSVLPAVTTPTIPNEWELFVPETTLDVKKIGIAQKHCVFSRKYYRSVASRKTFLFAFHKKNMPLSSGICVEAAADTGKIVQARGLHNRHATPEELDLASMVASKMCFVAGAVKPEVIQMATEPPVIPEPTQTPNLHAAEPTPFKGEMEEFDGTNILLVQASPARHREIAAVANAEGPPRSEPS